MLKRLILVGIMSAGLSQFTFGKGSCFTFIADSIEGNTGNQIQIRIRAIHFDSIFSFQGTLAFDPTVIRFDSLLSYGIPGLGPSGFNTANTASGWMTFAWYDPDLNGLNLPDTVNLFIFSATVIGTFGSHSTLKIIDNPTAIEVANFTLNVIPYCIDSGIVYVPNLTFTDNRELPKCEKTLEPISLKILIENSEELEIRDLNGKTVFGHLKMDPENSTFGGPSPLLLLPQGLYFVVSRQKNCLFTQKLTR